MRLDDELSDGGVSPAAPLLTHRAPRVTPGHTVANRKDSYCATSSIELYGTTDTTRV